MSALPPVVLRDFPGLTDYAQAVADMQALTAERTAATPDEIWLLQHPPVYTLGLNASRGHVVAPGNTPVVQTDRGGQVTYHGPGQLVIYALVDLARSGLGIRAVVCALEQAVVDLAASGGIEARARREAPGVYVGERKLASVGLRVRRHCTYHGLALNVSNDLAPFRGINPCGFEGLAVTSLSELGWRGDAERIRPQLAASIASQLGLALP
jgi:lipoyl(octanoyl) transferase